MTAGVTKVQVVLDNASTLVAAASEQRSLQRLCRAVVSIRGCRVGKKLFRETYRAARTAHGRRRMIMGV
jgi:hypothetical protein